MSIFKLLYVVIFIINLYETNAQISDKRLCVDKECKVPVSLAKTLLRYSSPDSRILSFAPNLDVTIYSKSAGSRADLWGGEISGKRGYIPKHMVRETKILKKPDVLVDTEINNQTDQPQVPLNNEKVQPNKVQEAFEVVDGTTIYLGSNDAIAPSSTESPVESSALPAAAEKSSEEELAPKEEKQESVVDNVLSTFSNWMGDEAKEDEGEDVEEDDEDDDEEEDDSEEADVEDEIDPKEPVNALKVEPTPENSVPTKEKSTDNNPEPADKVPELKSEEEPKREYFGNLGGSAQQVPETTEKTIEDALKFVSEESKPVVEDPVSSLQEAPSSVETLPLEEVPSTDSGFESDKVEAIDAKSEEVQFVSSPEIFGDVTEEPLSLPVTENIGEVTTILPPELEVPQSIDLGFEDVTPNPADVPNNGPEVVENPAPTLPPLGLFGNQYNVVQENSKEIGETEAASDNLDGLNVAPYNDKAGGLNEVGNNLPDNFQQVPIVDVNATDYSTNDDSGSFNDSVANSETIVGVTDDAVIENSGSLNAGSSNKNEGGLNDFVANSDPVVSLTDDSAIENSDGLNAGFGNENENGLNDFVANSETIADEPVDSAIENSGGLNVGFANENVGGLNDFTANSEEVVNVTDDLGIENSDGLNDFSFNEEIKTSPVEEVEITTRDQEQNLEAVEVVDESPGFFSNLLSFFGGNGQGGSDETVSAPGSMREEVDEFPLTVSKGATADVFVSSSNNDNTCDADATLCQKPRQDQEETVFSAMDLSIFSSEFFLYLATTAVSVIIFLFGYIAFDKNKREGPLVAKINKLEKQLLVVLKENQILQEKSSGETGYETTNDDASIELVSSLKRELAEITDAKTALEEQVQLLERELENSTEVGMELNRMLSEILSSQNGSEVLKTNVEHLQRQLVEQQSTVNSVNEALALTNTENHELKLEVELSNKKVADLQNELDKMCLNVMKIEEEKEQQQNVLESELALFKRKYEENCSALKTREEELNNKIVLLQNQLGQVDRNLELKTKELTILRNSVKDGKGGGVPQSMLKVAEIEAELQLFKSENQRCTERLQQEQAAKEDFEKRAKAAMAEAQRLSQQYEEADKLKVEAKTKLEVLSNYFKDREAQLQKEISKHESMWVEKQGEATSTTERIRFMQEQLQNYKSQTESLKQEIVSQEVELKSQISVLEKKVHENWVSARQAERKLEDAKQEASQLRHRLTLRERALLDEKGPHRLQSPIDQNGEIPVSPLHVESPASPPLLFGGRDHITKSPPIPGLPPFLPPVPGVPFMPPPLHGVPPFMPPNMFPGDHRPPPLGRMSSPPINSRYSPSSRGYSPYRNSSSPSDSEYGTSPPRPHRGYSPYNNRDDRRDYKRPPPMRSNGRNRGGASSGSANSNESLEKINRQQSKV